MNNPSTYPQFYGFSQKPFEVEPDLDSLFLVKSQKEALISMINGINERRGLILISGESGVGKTALLNYLQTKLPKKVKTILVSRVSIFFRQILKQITQELRLPPGDETPAFFLSQLRAHLTEGLARRENLAVFLDDAQNLNKETFEELRLLSQMQEGGASLVQIILAGQPELENILGGETLRPLNRQIQLRLQLQPLWPEESHLFVEQRLQRAGRSSGEVFTPEALDLIVSQGRGIFRNIIFLCDKAFRKGLDRKQEVIDAAIVWKILAEVDIPYREEPIKPQEITSRDSLLRRLFLKPRRVVPPGLLTEVISHLKRQPLYLYVVGLFVLGLVFYFGWELFLTPSPSRIQRSEAPAPVAKELTPIPAPQEKAEAPAQNAPIAPPEKNAEIVPPAPDREKAAPSPAEVKAEEKAEEKRGEKSEEKPAVKAPPRQASRAEPEKESISESKPEAKSEVRFNQTVDVPKGKTLFSFARDYYHHANPTLIDYILESNPHLKDMNRIPMDRKIKFPEISEESLFAQSPDGSWKIRLGTFVNLQEAKGYKGEPLLKEKKIETVQRQVAPATTWYRLYAGKFDSKEEALKTIRELRNKGLLPALKK